MSRKRIIGIVLIAVSLVLAVIVILEIQKTVTLSGPTLGSTATYNPPFKYHGPLTVAGGIVSVILLLVGLYLASPNRGK